MPVPPIKSNLDKAKDPKDDAINAAVDFCKRGLGSERSAVKLFDVNDRRTRTARRCRARTDSASLRPPAPPSRARCHPAPRRCRSAAYKDLTTEYRIVAARKAGKKGGEAGRPAAA
jgi:hypothetical protein